MVIDGRSNQMYRYPFFAGTQEHSVGLTIPLPDFISIAPVDCINSSSQIDANILSSEAKLREKRSQASLRAEIAALKQDLAALKQEKNDLEILLETTTEHSDTVEAELHDRAIEALQRSEEWFRTIAEATPVPVIISRLADDEIIYANVTASLTFGVSIEELIGRRTSDLYKNPLERQNLLDLVVRNGSIQNYELQCKRSDGSVFWVAASLSQLTFNGEATILSALCDITDRKQEEDALKRQLVQMQIEIDRNKLARQVAAITQTDYFQELKAEVERLRYPDEENAE
jgi:PAS domain S-box-containing protein